MFQRTVLFVSAHLIDSIPEVAKHVEFVQDHGCLFDIVFDAIVVGAREVGAYRFDLCADRFGIAAEEAVRGFLFGAEHAADDLAPVQVVEEGRVAVTFAQDDFVDAEVAHWFIHAQLGAHQRHALVVLKRKGTVKRKQKLGKIVAQNKRLRKAYLVKEDFADFYACQTRDEAETYLRDWTRHCKRSGLVSDQDLARRLRTLRPPRLPAFRQRPRVHRQGPAPLAQAAERGHVLRRGSPRQNAYSDNFNDKLRDECLIMEVVQSLPGAQVITEVWRVEYNTDRSRCNFGYLTLEEFHAKWEANDKGPVGALRPHPRDLSH